MSKLQDLQSRYADLMKKNSKLPKNQRRYSTIFKKDILRHLEQGGDKDALAQWLDIQPRSLINLTRQIPSTLELPDKASVFLKVQSKELSDCEITITYPSGLVLKLPIKM